MADEKDIELYIRQAIDVKMTTRIVPFDQTKVTPVKDLEIKISFIGDEQDKAMLRLDDVMKEVVKRVHDLPITIISSSRSSGIPTHSHNEDSESFAVEEENDVDRIKKMRMNGRGLGE